VSFPAQASGESRARKLLCLTGFMGSGKTTVGRLLAQHIGWHFADLDSDIEATAGMSIARIFEERGELAFRQMEWDVLSRLVEKSCSLEQPTVLALGGGTFDQPPSRELLRTTRATVIWLDCPVEELLARLAGVKDRPLFRDEASFRQLFEQRLFSYRLADFRVNAAVAPRRVVEEILALEVFEQMIPR
jgi:shikimate kinase